MVMVAVMLPLAGSAWMGWQMSPHLYRNAVRKTILEKGIRLLSDETHLLSIGDGQIAVSGCDFPWGSKIRPRLQPPAGLLHLVLSHTPDNIYALAKQGADLVFSGHNHAGQLRILGLGSIVVPSVYGRRFDHGHFVVNGTHLFVASGIGAAVPPLRLYCPPDIFIVDVGGPDKG